MAVVTVPDIRGRKGGKERFAVVTAYDYTQARIAAAAEIPVILVGDSLATVMLGYPSTIQVTMEEMLHHARAVTRGAPEKLLVGDMPFGSYHASHEEAIRNAGSFLKAGMHAVKLEGSGPVIQIVSKLVERGIPAMAHIGLTPQFVNTMGGLRVQGKNRDSAAQIKRDALELQDAGAFALVLEGIPHELATEITTQLEIPTIGIGAGAGCDAQVLVIHDLLGLTQSSVPKFVKPFANLGDQAIEALRKFATEVAKGEFPDADHSYN